MIPHKFHLFWCGGPISYLRYMTFATLRRYHPDWEIYLYLGNKYRNEKWVHEAQDFQQTFDCDYTPKVRELVNGVREYSIHEEVAPNFQSDFFRWDILASEGGFYLDTDQIILKPFDYVASQYEFIYALYDANGPVGVLGAVPGSAAVSYIRNRLPSLYQPSNYNSIGPQMFIQVMAAIVTTPWFMKIKSWNSGRTFYPIGYSHDVRHLYDGSFNIPSESLALHWFGGHPHSQAFNKQFTEEFAKTSNDTISRFIRSIGL